MDTITKEEHYELLSNDIKGQVSLLRYDFLAKIESKADVEFWRRCFEKYAPDKKFDLLPESNSPKGNTTTGVEHCLKFKPYLDKTFFICIDSDYRYLLQEAGIGIENHIFQTYTHSVENHYCYSGGLNTVCKQSSGFENTIFNFNNFLEQYSQIIYKLLLVYLHHVKNNSSKLSHKEFLEAIKVDIKQSENLVSEENIQKLLTELKEKVNNKLASIETDDRAIVELGRELESTGLTERNAYLYIQGHCLCSLIEKLGKGVCKCIFEAQNEIIGKDELEKKRRGQKLFGKVLPLNLQFEAYPEIDKIKNDIERYFS